MWRRSLRARRVSLTSYAIFLAEFGEDFARRACASFGDVFEPLAESLFRIGKSGKIKQSLVSGGVLQHSFRLAVDGENNGPFRFLELLHELDRIIPKRSQWLNVLRNVDPSWHNTPPALKVFYRTFEFVAWPDRKS